MSKSGLFAHFGSKQELQLAIVEAAAQRFREAVIDPVNDVPDGGGRLRAMTSAYIADLESNCYSGGCFWAATSTEYDDRPGPVRDAIAGALDAWFGELERQARLAGAADPERLAFELYALVMGANSRFRLSGDRRVFAYAARLRRGAAGGAAGMTEAAAEERAADFVRRFAEFWSAPSPTCWRCCSPTTCGSSRR